MEGGFTVAGPGISRRTKPRGSQVPIADYLTSSCSHSERNSLKSPYVGRYSSDACDLTPNAQNKTESELFVTAIRSPLNFCLASIFPSSLTNILFLPQNYSRKNRPTPLDGRLSFEETASTICSTSPPSNLFSPLTIQKIFHFYSLNK
jgi:hypothetical protein